MKTVPTTILLILLAGVTGCPPPGRPGVRNGGRKAPPRDFDKMVSAINANAAKLDRALWSSSVHVVARIVDSKGKEHAYNFDGNLLYQKPRMLSMNLRHGLGTPVMQVGSNDDDYWAWIEPEMEQMWWGRHRNVGKSCVGKINVRPEHMVAVLGVGALPRPGEGLTGPMRALGNQYDILYYTTVDSRGRNRIARRYFVDRVAPYQVRLIVFLDEKGEKEMSAYLDDYKPAWQGGPMVAHAVSIFWPKEKGKFTLMIDRVVGKTAREISTAAFSRPTPAQLPAKVRPNIEQIDADCDSQ